MNKLGQGPEPTLEFTVAPDGSVTIEAMNFQGPACKLATKPFEEALGVVASDADKPEIHLKPIAAVTKLKRTN